MTLDEMRSKIRHYPFIHKLVRIFISRNIVFKIIKRFRRIISGSDAYIRPTIKIPNRYFGKIYRGYCVAIENLNEKSIVYSFGIGRDISFETELNSNIGCNISLFDPSPIAGKWLQNIDLPSSITYYKYAISDYDGHTYMSQKKGTDNVNYSLNKNKTGEKVSVRSLSSLMNEFGHKYVDVLKMDVEGEEFVILKDIVKNKIIVRQVVLELHHRFEEGSAELLHNTIQMMSDAGYGLFYVSLDGMDYSFIKSLK